MMKNLLTLLLITFSLQSFAQGLWYRDRDLDGFGDPNFPTAGAFIPPGFVADNTDCDDFNFFVNPDKVWYKDADFDGFTDGTFVKSCTQPVGYTSSPSVLQDCFDNDPTLNYITWYLDKDGDGYITQESFKFPSVSCENLTDLGGINALFVKGEDCNDDDPNIYTLVLYLDNDRDGFPASSEPIKTCGGIASHPYYLASQLNSLAVDCDDSDQNNIPTTVWFEDQDNDGYTSGVSMVSCAQPSGFIQNPLRDGDGPNLLLDCNDKDAVQRPNQAWYEDNDRDGYGKDFIDGGQLILACQRPKGNWFARSELTALGDCNDNVASLNSATQWVLDGDGDGHYSGDKVVQCSSPGPGYLVFNTQLPGDCDDNNADINPKTLWFLDADGDGYSSSISIPSPEGSCLPPQDGRNYIFNPNGTDCDDNNATKWRTGIFLIDTDNDDYVTGQAVICYGEEIPDGYKTTTIGFDCDDTDPAITMPRVWYQDLDDDSYSDGNFLMQCERPTGYKLEGELTATSGDCDESDATVNIVTFWLLDADKDGYHEKLFIAEFPSCLPPQDGRNYINNSKGQDCNDNDPTYTPETVWVKDADGDGYFIGEPLIGCLPIFTTGYIRKTNQQPGDCNDTDAAINPGATEACDGIDNNCNLQTDEGFPDANNNGVADCVDPDNDMISFTLINAGTDMDIFTLTDGLQISQNQVQGLSLNIRANTNPSVVGSVFITISGPVSRTITENVAPYALFGDRNGDYNGRNLPSGNYTLTATPYSQTNRGGTAGATTTIQFSIVPETVSVTGITTTPSTASIAVGSTLQVTATVLPSNATNKTVVWSTSDQEVATVSASGLVSAISPGVAIITATTQDGNFFDITEVTVTNASPLSIGSFTLINAGTDTDILTLTDGLQISQSQIQGLSLNIRANTNPLVVGSVFLRISGPINRTITENVAPYALFGDKNGNYNGRNLPVGNYTLEATPYSQSNRRGTMGSTRTIKFSITSDAFRMDGTQTESDESENPQENADVMEKEVQARDIPKITRMYPNPVAEIINLELSGQVEEHLEVSIYDLKGVRLFNQELKSEDGTLMLDISDLRLKPGMFVLMVNTNGYLQTFKFLKK
ncbi:Ig-like domain-containing protein [Aquiflexum gelatinilyticum]|uniref:Ig-like domain-containing protein n=1 Tax=Aquiflexum gelatinilyticum TaxID=2961943 RepID=UPI002168FC97|nr:Ig-like domain-containing protein [Aquiflexum gelatinilyticum]MCS4436001.1 Ig-like domain-containing protein [Aquiflexum gelatinilyticum]